MAIKSPRKRGLFLGKRERRRHHTKKTKKNLTPRHKGNQEESHTKTQRHQKKAEKGPHDDIGKKEGRRDRGFRGDHVFVANPRPIADGQSV